MTNTERLELADKVQNAVVGRTKEFKTNQSAAEIDKIYFKTERKNHEKN